MLKNPLLHNPAEIEAVPLHIETLWDDMFWRVRGIGYKGLAFVALSTLTEHRAL